MNFNKNSKYEKSLVECPRCCGECNYCQKGEKTDFCIANGASSVTYGFCNPKDTSIPYPLNCYWWYANRVLKKLDSVKILGIMEERIHLFVASRILENLPYGKERTKFIEHIFRAGGGRLINLELYPNAKIIYTAIKKEMKEELRGKKNEN